MIRIVYDLLLSHQINVLCGWAVWYRVIGFYSNWMILFFRRQTTHSTSVCILKTSKKMEKKVKRNIKSRKKNLLLIYILVNWRCTSLRWRNACPFRWFVSGEFIFKSRYTCVRTSIYSDWNEMCTLSARTHTHMVHMPHIKWSYCKSISN